MLSRKDGSGEQAIDSAAYLRLWRTGEFDAATQPLLAWLRAQRLAPILGWRAKQRGWTLPEEVSRFVQTATYQGVARHTIVGSQIEELANLFRKAKIPAVVVKGPVVASAYPDTSLRIYNDLDFLVPEGQAASLITALIKLGYSAQVSGDRSMHFPPLHPEGAGLRLEIHDALDKHLDGDWFTFSQWSDRMRKWTSYPGLWVPDPVDHMIYLIDHALIRHELLGGLQLLNDLWFWTKEWGAYKWEVLESRSQQLGLFRAVNLALSLTAWFWDEALSDPAGQRFPTPPSDVLAQSQALALGSFPAFIPHVWRDLAANRPLQWVRYGINTFFGDPEYRKSLSVGNRILFYLRRPLRLWQHYASVLWRLIVGKTTERSAWEAKREVSAWLRELD